jgi:hypothetical protein
MERFSEWVSVLRFEGYMTKPVSDQSLISTIKDKIKRD